MNKYNRGFTLFETIFVFVIAGIFLLAVNNIIFTVKKGNILSQQLSQVKRYSQNILEYLKQQEFNCQEGIYNADEIIDDEIYDFITDNINKNLYKRTKINITKIEESLRENSKLYDITINVNWKGVSGAKKFKIRTYKFER